MARDALKRGNYDLAYRFASTPALDATPGLLSWRRNSWPAGLRFATSTRPEVPTVTSNGWRKA
jgi:hypothetical protein